MKQVVSRSLFVFLPHPLRMHRQETIAEGVVVSPCWLALEAKLVYATSILSLLQSAL